MNFAEIYELNRLIKLLNYIGILYILSHDSDLQLNMYIVIL